MKNHYDVHHDYEVNKKHRRYLFSSIVMALLIAAIFLTLIFTLLSIQ